MLVHVFLLAAWRGRYPGCTQLLLGSALADMKLGNADSARELFTKAVQVHRLAGLEEKQRVAWGVRAGLFF